MITNSKEKVFPTAKQEGAPAGEEKQLYKALSVNSRQWSSSGFHNPRIVRVSRTFGGKDRHSKVCTVRGLRDRRIRLSVPTAVQLYDLQDRLGLSQPSKVIDWLIDATKQDIDKLPPLQIPQGVWGQFLHHPNIHDHHDLNLLPHHDHHHHQAKTNEQDQFVQKLFGNMSSTASNMGTTHYQNPDQTTSLLGHGISLPGGQYLDGVGHGNLVMSTNPSTTPSSFNPASIQSVPQLFFCAPPPPPPPPPPLSNSTASLFGTPYPPYIGISHENNPHYTIRSQMINNHIQLLSGSSSISTSTSSSSLPSSQQYHNHHHHVLNNSLMSSLHDITNSKNKNDENRTPLMKSFPSILNRRQLFVQSTSTSAAYENRPEKDSSTAD